MKDILSSLKEEFNEHGVLVLSTEKSLEVIRALEELADLRKAWKDQYRTIERLQGREYELETRIEGLRRIAMRAVGHMPYSEATIYQQDIDKILNEA